MRPSPATKLSRHLCSRGSPVFQSDRKVACLFHFPSPSLHLSVPSSSPRAPSHPRILKGAPFETFSVPLLRFVWLTLWKTSALLVRYPNSSLGFLEPIAIRPFDAEGGVESTVRVNRLSLRPYFVPFSKSASFYRPAFIETPGKGIELCGSLRYHPQREWFNVAA